MAEVLIGIITSGVIYDVLLRIFNGIESNRFLDVYAVCTYKQREKGNTDTFWSSISFHPPSSPQAWGSGA
jgi:hypothetical protein